MMTRASGSLLILVASMLPMAGCNESLFTPGGPGDPCADTSDCEAGLVCLDEICVVPDTPDGDGDVDGDSDGDGDGSVCVDEDHDGFDAFSESCPAGDDCDDGDHAVNPAAEEVCGDGVDNNCDGEADEPPCRCTRGNRRACYSGPDGTAGVGTCRRGVQLCGPDGEYGPCVGDQPPEVSEESACDGRDEDCDGRIDEDLTNPCGGCGEAPVEVCGDGIDNSCDGVVDEGCDCDPDCLCDHDGCVCRPPVDQPCYEGAPATMGRGICHGGLHDCVEVEAGTWAWSACRGQQPPATECVGGVPDGADNDCDGMVDEGCLPDGDGDGFAPPDDCDDTDASIHPGATETCNERDDDCDGVADDGVRNACGGCGTVGAEACGNGLDDDCDGDVDEDCSCGGALVQSCYSGPAGTAGVAHCRAGEQECVGSAEFERWGTCEGEVLPEIEICDGADNDCDAETDERWAAGANPCGFCVFTETCDGLDNDCDGHIDEGLRNGCGDCLPVAPETECDGVDNDCDGLVDEGLVNACGQCPPDPCYTDTWDSEDDWDDGESDGVSTAPETPLHEACESPDTVCLDAATARLGHIWIANAADNELVRMNVDSGAVELEVLSRGHTPSRTAVDTRDGSVWVANRAYCCGGNPNDGEQSNVVHFSSDGTVLCRIPLPGMVRALAIDADYDIWAGLWEYREIVHIDGDGCREIERQNVGCRPYGAAVDQFGNAWFVCNETWLHSFDPNVQSLVQVPVDAIARFTRHVPVGGGISCFNLYGLAVDSRGRVWGASIDASCGNVYRYDPAADTWAFIHTGGSLRGVAIDREGNAYVADSSTNRRVLRVDPDMTGFDAIALGDAVSDTVGAAVDYAGRVWVVSRGSNNASRIDVSVWPPVVEHFGTAGRDPYTYSDMTGMQHLLHTNPTGTWTVNFDSGYARALWSFVEWDAIEPPGTDIYIRARTAPSEEGLEGATWSDAYSASPAPVHADPRMVTRNRWIQVEVTLTTTDSETTPVLTSVNVRWEH